MAGKAAAVPGGGKPRVAVCAGHLAGCCWSARGKGNSPWRARSSGPVRTRGPLSEQPSRAPGASWRPVLGGMPQWRGWEAWRRCFRGGLGQTTCTAHNRRAQALAENQGDRAQTSPSSTRTPCRSLRGAGAGACCRPGAPLGASAAGQLTEQRSWRPPHRDGAPGRRWRRERGKWPKRAGCRPVARRAAAFRTACTLRLSTTLPDVPQLCRQRLLCASTPCSPPMRGWAC